MKDWFLPPEIEAAPIMPMTFFAFAKGKTPAPPPDPGKYDVPSTLGGPKFSFGRRQSSFPPRYAPKYTLLPSTLSKQAATIGPRTSLPDYTSETSGPDYVESSGNSAPKVAIHLRRSYPSDHSPGPGTYSLPGSLSGPAYTFGRRHVVVRDHIIVAPGTYDMPAPIGHPITIAERPCAVAKKKVRSHPGPIYDVRPRFGGDAPSATFPHAGRDFPTITTPGPGAYDPLTSFGNKSQLAPRFGPRTSEPPPELNRMPYYDLGGTIRPLRRSLGGRSETTFSTISPGPRYNLRTAFDGQSTTIGARIPTKNPMAENPAPDSYWMVPELPKAPPIAGFVGPGDRCPVDLRNEAQKPGPGYYEASPGLGAATRGCALRPKPRNDLKVDTAAPYYPAPSSLGGPMFTIGLRDV